MISSLRRTYHDVKGDNPGSRTFHYGKLSTGEIRLLSIQPGDDGPMICDLIENVSVRAIKSGSIKFDALSYRWGGGLRQISLNGHKFRIGSNLNDALRVMRRSDHPRLVWTDAICINQNPDKAAEAEKAIQVKMMCDIYGLATQTVVWLGPEADSSDLAMDFISSQAVLESTRANPSMDLRWKGLTTDDDFFHAVRDPELVPTWEALFKLCKREYWSRMWIIQEIALSAEPVVHCGSKHVRWVDFELVIGLIFAMISDRVPGSTYFWHLTPLLEDNLPLLLEQLRNPDNVRKDTKWLLSALHRHRTFDAKFAEDKIFGLLGLLDQETRDKITVDYNTPIATKYAKIFKLLVPAQRWSEAHGEVVTGDRPTMTMNLTFTTRADDASSTSSSPVGTSRLHGPLNILGCAGYSSSRTNALPSWVPNWEDKDHPSTIDNITGCRMLTTDDLEPSYRIHGNKVLETGGYEFGALRWISSSPNENVSENAGITTNYDEALVCSAADALSEAIIAGVAGHTFDAERFWRTLVLDSFPTLFYTRAPDAWVNMDINVLGDFVNGEDLSDEAKALLPSEYIIMLRRTLKGRKFAVTDDGMYVVVPEEANIGDKVCAIWGCDVPVVLGRRYGRLVLVGACYCDALADGTWLDNLTEEECLGPRGTFSIY